MSTASLSRDNYDYIRKSLVLASGAGAGVAFHSNQALAIDIGDVNSAMTTIIGNTDTAADSALPIGAALLALAVISMVIKRFIMAA